MDFFIEALDFLSRNRFGFIMFTIVIFAFVKVLSSATKISATAKKALGRTTAFLLLASILMVIFGTEFTNQLIYQHGQIGEGLVVNTFETGDLYNEEPVIQYDALIKTQTGETVKTSFENTDFNLYPTPAGRYNYPSQGVRFTVKHLKNNPKAFVIINNDDSAYAVGKSCAEQLQRVNTAKSQYDFDSNNSSFKESYRKSIEAYLALNCTNDSTIVNFYEQEKSKLE